jgi:tRNA(adenine34) deaminase
MLSSSMGVELGDRRSPAQKRNLARGPVAELIPKATDGIQSARAQAFDLEQMAALAAFTARSLRTARPRPFGASVVHTESGAVLLRALNMVAQEIDPSSHAEVRAIRLATKRLKTLSLAGYTLYTTCEPCPMCMSTALWSGLDRVVYGATIEDANRHCNQILIPAVEVAARSDMKCVVDGPVLRDKCYALFTDPRMLRAFRVWSTRRQP